MREGDDGCFRSPEPPPPAPPPPPEEEEEAEEWDEEWEDVGTASDTG
jgi:hypothetical protein